MKFLGSAVQSGFIYLTAVSTLIAAVPHFDCVCPNGAHKPFCLGSSSSPRSGCCCGSSCCSSSADGGCCCQDKSSRPGQVQACCKNPQARSDAPVVVNQVKGKCCTKTLAEGQSVSVAPKAGGNEKLADNFSVPLAQPQSFSSVPVAGQPFAWHRCDLPPPPDLIIALHHFLI